MRIAAISIVTLSFSLGCSFGAVAQTRNAAAEHWQAIDKSMSDLLLEGYRPVSVIAPSSLLRIYFLNSGSLLAKCTEQATAGMLPSSATPSPSAMPPLSAQQPASALLPGQQLASAQLPPTPPPAPLELQVTFACSRLSKSQ